MAKYQLTRGHSNGGIFSVLAVSFVGMLVLFGWQTWLFVNWLFPNDQLVMKCLTLFSFDVMAFIWAVTRQFYRFAHPHAKVACSWAKWVTFTCSLLASIVYMTLQFIVRFSGVVSPELVSLSEAISIIVLVFNILMVMIFLSAEISTRYPNEDEYVFVDRTPVPAPMLVAQQHKQDFNLIEENQDENEDNQLENGDNQVEKPYTHNGPAEKSWGGSRKGSGRRGKE